MTSFELFRLLKLKKIYFIYIFLYFFLLKYIMDDKLPHFMKKKSKTFASNSGIITSMKIKLCKKSCRKEKWVGLKNLICINFKCL